MIAIRKAGARGQTQLDWLTSYHTFSFGDYRDPQHMGFSDLRVINDDLVLPTGGFATHAHRDMEILTYILSGSLEHQDSMGNGSEIRAGDIQIMTAGSGVTHSEFNPSKKQPVHLLQIWIFPNQRSLPPRYQQESIDPKEKRGKLKLIVSPVPDEAPVHIHQDARVYAALLDGKEKIVFDVPAKRSVFVQVASGTLTVNGQRLDSGDGASISDEKCLEFSHGQDAEFLLFDLRQSGGPLSR